ncbi:serine/threonine-protein kinase [Micromonospora sp. MH33]|uniref:serine/threonine-protein kinase n=1 Tax=Micromonospora sp. MH33 TaxID=1945509 RepID=UPI001FED3D4F|nr:serine/threonine-protein kinase [Micromonospora sp. MH33]
MKEQHLGYGNRMPDVGDLIGDRYRLVDRIAAGGMGEVWRAVDQTLKRTVAVKVLHSRVMTDASAGERFRREARAMAALRHPGVAEVYDYGETTLPGASGLAFIVMAYVQGQSLSERIAEAGRLSATETLSIVAQTARALQAAHDVNVVHRDVKPGNLIIEPDGHVVLVDFGIALSPDATELTAANQVVGTALYMAPEQLTRSGVIGPAVDIYALGCVAYHCLAGRPPFAGDNPVAVALRRLEEEPPPLPDDVPAAVRDLVASAMAKNADHRIPTAAAMAATADAIADSADGRTATALAAPAVPRAASPTTRQLPLVAGPPARAAGRRRAVAGIVLALAAAAAAAVALADPAGWSPGPSGVPPPSVVRSDPNSGGGDSPRTPTRARNAPADPDLTTPASRSSEPGPAGSLRSRDNGPAATSATPSRARSSGPSVEPTGEPTGEPRSQSASPSPQTTN